ncbi:MAG: PEP-utilizing enzyme [bacterium]
MSQIKKIIYQTYPRDYSIVGATAISDEYVSKKYGRFNGQMLPEVISVIKNGRYIYIIRTDSLYDICRTFIRKKLNTNKVNLPRLWKQFDSQVKEYFSLLDTPVTQYSKEMILDVYDYYKKMIPVAYLATYVLDCLDEVEPAKRKSFSKWIKRARKRAELIYKQGESEFIPKYLKWLVENELKEYDPKLLEYVYCQEMERWIIGKAKLPSMSELKKRHKLLVIHQYPVGKFRLLTGSKAKQFLDKLKISQSFASDTREMKGVVAQPGKVTGIVKIVCYAKEMTGFRKGQILVSAMTQPAFLPAMKKAAAFVTDEGGTLSHAAIMARELKKPCIIGTKIATKVLKNGDMVEVDATKGIVRKI